jgi:hypothetical protein
VRAADQQVLRRDQLIWREVDGRVVGIDLRSSRYFSLNPTATFLWKLLGDGAAPDDLTERLSAEFALDRGLAAEDVSAFLASLEAGGLLES